MGLNSLRKTKEDTFLSNPRAYFKGNLWHISTQEKQSTKIQKQNLLKVEKLYDLTHFMIDTWNIVNHILEFFSFLFSFSHIVFALHQKVKLVAKESKDNARNPK